ncbi:uncharacterized protein BDV17DRAFT_10729 [Aspergillus undulatus]|uniref:uncharacterized protein n=1 Tax=Aspergillus undulatus TaxID=1810928 RepID=UPI003CCDDF7C
MPIIFVHSQIRFCWPSVYSSDNSYGHLLYLPWIPKRAIIHVLRFVSECFLQALEGHRCHIVTFQGAWSESLMHCSRRSFLPPLHDTSHRLRRMTLQQRCPTTSIYTTLQSMRPTGEVSWGWRAWLLMLLTSPTPSSPPYPALIPDPQTESTTVETNNDLQTPDSGRITPSPKSPKRGRQIYHRYRQVQLVFSLVPLTYTLHPFNSIQPRAIPSKANL